MLAGRPIPQSAEELLAAIAGLEEQLHSQPSNPYLLVTLAGCYRTLAEVEAKVVEPGKPWEEPTEIWSTKHLERALSLCLDATTSAPDFLYAKAMLANLHLDLGQLDDAVPYYEAVIEATRDQWHPHEAIADEVVADCLRNLGWIYLGKALPCLERLYGYALKQGVHDRDAIQRCYGSVWSAYRYYTTSVNLRAFDESGEITY